MLKRRLRSIHSFQDNNTSHSVGPVDFPLVVTAVILVVIGLIMVYDASVVHAYKDFGDKYFYIKQQSLWVALGFFCLFFFSKFNYHFLKVLSLPMFLVSILMLLAVFLPGLGVDAGGAHRWLRLGFFSVQPAEIVKLTTVIFFATLFEKKVRLAPFAITVVAISAIIGVLQKDLGSTVVFFLTMVGFYVVSGAPLKIFGYVIPFSLLGFLVFVFSSTYRKQRILAFLDPFADSQGYSFHITQVLIALGSGGLTGVGIGQSRQKFEYVPEVSTDSIFSIVGEELGFIGSVFLIGLLSFLVYRGFKIAENTSDDFGRLLAYGLTMWLGIQTLVNLGAMVSLIPLTGVPLPFISYGGSALLVNLVGVGILANISRSANMNS